MKTSFFPLGTTDTFDSLFEELFDKTITKAPSYPPCNIYEDEDGAFIEIAVTGLDESNLKAYNEDGYLVVEGTYPETKERDYQFRSLSKKDFTRKFWLKDWDVDYIDVKNGIMIIKLKKEEPEKKYIEFRK